MKRPQSCFDWVKFIYKKQEKKKIENFYLIFTRLSQKM